MSSSIRVLHVDDDPEFLDLASTFLEREEDRFEVVTETDAATAIDRLDEVDCVVSDYRMPEIDGLEFLRVVREEDEELPFVLFTGQGSEEIASEAISAGVTDYLQKGGPETYTVLANRVRNAVEKARAERELERSEARLRRIIDLLPHYVFVKDEDGTYLLSNEAHASFHGTTVESIEGTDGSHVLDETERKRFLEDDREVIETGEPKHIPEEEVTDADGETHVFETRKIPFDLAETEKRAVLAVATDITELKERQRQIEALHEFSRQLMRAGTREEVAEITARAAENVLGYSLNTVRLLSGDGRRLLPSVVSEDTPEAMGDRPVYEVGEGPPGRALQEGEPLVYDDVSEIDDDYDRGEARAGMYLPLGEEGTLSIVELEPGGFDESNVHLASILAANAEAALNRVDREQELARRNERLDEFASVVSHDLRNPLNVAQGTFELLDLDCPRADRLGRALDRMDELIDDVLTLARHGQGAGSPEQVEVIDLAEEA